MKRFFQSHIVTVGLAIFSMLFGAGNLMYPLLVGIKSGEKIWYGMGAFLITAVLLPLIGLTAMILFDGNYEAFFARLGKRTGSFFIFLCMLIIGPGLVIPRIVTLSHVMMSPFIPNEFLSSITQSSSLVFTLLFLAVTFLFTYKESKIVTILGNVISPVLLLSLIIIIVKGYFGATGMISNNQPALTIVKDNLLLGYGTLDLLGAIFFCAIVLSILRHSLGSRFETDKRLRLTVGFQAGLLGVSLLALIYGGMALLGSYYGNAVSGVSDGLLFREIALLVLGKQAAIIIAIAVLLACLSTAIALSAVCAEYVQKKLFSNGISYLQSLLLVLVACIPLCIFGLTTVLQLTGGPITYIGYPVLITLTFANIAYSLFGFKPVKLPVLAVFIITLISYFR